MCVRGGGGFKPGARLRDAANDRKQKFLSLVKELKSIRYPVTSSPSFVRSLVLEAENFRIASITFQCFDSLFRLLFIFIDSYFVYRTIGYNASYSADPVFEFQHEYR
jgi:hypothetical protein